VAHASELADKPFETQQQLDHHVGHGLLLSSTGLQMFALSVV